MRTEGVQDVQRGTKTQISERKYEIMIDLEKYLPEDAAIDDDLKSLVERETDEETIARCELMSRIIMDDRKRQSECAGYLELDNGDYKLTQEEYERLSPMDKAIAKYQGRLPEKQKQTKRSSTGKTGLDALIEQYSS